MRAREPCRCFPTRTPALTLQVHNVIVSQLHLEVSFLQQRGRALPSALAALPGAELCSPPHPRDTTPSPACRPTPLMPEAQLHVPGTPPRTPALTEPDSTGSGALRVVLCARATHKRPSAPLKQTYPLPPGLPDVHSLPACHHSLGDERGPLLRGQHQKGLRKYVAECKRNRREKAEARTSLQSQTNSNPTDH